MQNETTRHKGKQEERQAGRQDGRQAVRQRETKGDKTSGRRRHHTTKGSKKGCNGRQRETRPSGRWMRHLKKGNKKRYNGKQGERRSPEGGHTIEGRDTIQHRNAQHGTSKVLHLPREMTWSSPKCCTCHEKCSSSCQTVAQLLRLPHKTNFDTL